MGTIADALGRILPVNRAPPIFPTQTMTTSSVFSPGAVTFARAYTNNEIVFSAIEMLATSAGEPHIVGRKWTRNSPQIRNEEQRLQVRGVGLRDIKDQMIANGFYKDMPNHPLIRLLDAPNPWMSRGQLWGTVVMDRCLAGNAYLVKARAGGGLLKGAVAELWRLRPDRVRIIPSADKYIEAYEYGSGQTKVLFPPEDVIHFKTRHPLDEYYGMPPLMPISGRIDIDDYMRTFLKKFFEGGGTGPGSILTVKEKMSQDQKDQIRERFRRQFGGQGGYHEMLVLDQAQTTYQQLGLNRGLRDALPKELDAMQEARIAMVFGIPGSILGLLIGYESSSYANKRQDWQVFWDLTMTPLLSDLDDVLNLQLVPEYSGIDEVLFDLSDIRALQEDVDKLHDRARKNFQAGAWSFEEMREATGKDPDIKKGTFFVAANVVPTEFDDLTAEPEPPLIPFELPEPEEQPNPNAVARCPCGRILGRGVSVGAVLWCPRCKQEITIGA